MMYTFICNSSPVTQSTLHLFILFHSHISLSRLLEDHPDCLQVSIDQAVPASEFSGASPVGDKCLGVVLNCAYEEDVREARTNLRWYEASPGSTLFHIVSYANQLLLILRVHLNQELFLMYCYLRDRREMLYLRAILYRLPPMKNGEEPVHCISCVSMV